jgi:hypothetical protein
MLRLDLAQVPRLLHIETNTRDRLDDCHDQTPFEETATPVERMLDGRASGRSARGTGRRVFSLRKSVLRS